MNAYWLGAITGAVLFGFVWSRLWLWIAKKFVKVDPTRTFIAYGLAWVLGVVVGAFGLADGGPPDWMRALATYTPALAVWLAFDMIRQRKTGKLTGI